MTWFPHFLNVLKQSLQYKILCECEKGPVVIEHNNSTGVIFHIMDKYKDTVLFMENFIKNKFNEIQHKLFQFKTMDDNYIPKHEKKEIPAIFKYYISSINTKKNNSSFENLNNTNMDKVTNSLAFSRIKNIKNEANYVGFSINNRDMIFVENNYINQNPIISTKKRKKIVSLHLGKENNKLNNENFTNIFSSKTLRKNLAEFDKKKNILKSVTNREYISLNDKDDENNILKKRNIFLSYNNKKPNKNNNHLFFLEKSKNKIKYRLKSTKFSNRTTYNDSNQKSNDLNRDNNHNELLPKFSIALKKNASNKEIDEDEDNFEDIYKPKYPRPAILSGRNDEKKIPSYSMNLGKLNNQFIQKDSINFFDLGLLHKKKFSTIMTKKA